MKIYYISGSTIPSDMANAVHVMKMCQAFAKAGHEVTLFGKAGDGDGDAFDRYGVQSHFDLCLSPHRNIKYVSGVERVLYTVFQAYKRGKPDVFYGRDPVALALLSTLGVPCIFEAHQLPTSALQELCVRRLIAQTGKVVCISEALKQDFREMFPEIIETRVLVAHDGADLPEDGLEMQAPELPGRDGVSRAGYAGSLHKGKGVGFLLEIANITPDTDFHVFGGKPAQIETLKPHPENVFFHGHQDHKAIPGYLASMDVLLAPYQKEISIGTGKDISRWISPLKLFEYMAARRPILCSDLPIMREVLEHNRNAGLFPSDDPKPWSAAITKIIANEPFEAKLTDEAFQDLQSKYTWDARAQSILNFV